MPVLRYERLGVSTCGLGVPDVQRTTNGGRLVSKAQEDMFAEYARLTTQREKLRFLLTRYPSKWWTLAELNKNIGASEAGISARLRDMRKPQYGSYDIEKRHDGSLWHYRIRPVSVL